MAEDATREGFQPVWLYQAGRDAEYVESQAEYEALLAQGGWVHSPAEFGQVTAPSREQAALLGPGPPTPGVPTSEALLLHLHSQQESYQMALVKLQGQVDGIASDLATFKASLTHALERLDTLVKMAGGTGAGGTAGTQGTGRRS